MPLVNVVRAFGQAIPLRSIISMDADLTIGSRSNPILPLPGCMLKPPAGRTYTIPMMAADIGSFQWIDLSLGGVVAFTRGARRFLDVTWWGAIPFVSSEAAITAAARAGSVSKTPVWIPPGSFAITGPIALAGLSDVDLYGAGPNRTQLLATGGWSVLSITGISTRVRLRDLWVGHAAEYDDGAGISIVGTPGARASDIIIQNVTIQNSPIPLNLQYVDSGLLEYIKIVQSIVDATKATAAIYMMSDIGLDLKHIIVAATAGTFPGHGIVTDSDCDTIHMTDCSVGQTQLDCYAWRHTQGIMTTPPRLPHTKDCSAENSVTGAGFLVEDAREADFQGCEAAVNVYGLHVTGGSGIRWIGGKLWQNERHGALLEGGVGVSIDNAGITDNSTETDDTYSGVYIDVDGAAVRGSRIGNYVFDGGAALHIGQKYGVYIAAGNDYYLVTDNILADGDADHNNKTSGISDAASGANAVVTDNVGA